MYKLMIIDDEYYFRQSLKQFVNYADFGFEFIGEANNGQIGYELIQDLKPDVVLVDINMPIMNGLDLIEKCYNNNINCKFILITGYSEFEYAQRALKFNVSNYLLKPINESEFIECLQSIKNQIDSYSKNAMKFDAALNQNKQLTKESYMNKFISGYYFKELEDNSSIKLAEFFVSSYDNYTVALVACAKIITIDEIENIKIENVELSAFYTVNNHLCIIINYINETNISDIISELYEHLSVLYETDIKIFTGNEYSGISKIVLSYNEALLTLRSKINDDSKIISYNSINEKYTNELFSKVIKNKIIASMSDSNSDLTTSYINAVFSDCKTHEASYNTIALVSINLINTIFFIAFKYSMEKFMAIHNDIINMIIAKKDVQVIENEIIAVASKIIENIPDYQISTIVSQTLDYIDKEYQNQELNVKLLSEELHINYSYLCASFKNDMNITLNNYITKFRLEKAKAFFDDGTVNVSFVAQGVGYQDVSYFSKSFKKMYGLSPMSYIKQI